MAADWLEDLQALADELDREFGADDDPPARPVLTLIQGGRDA